MELFHPVSFVQPMAQPFDSKESFCLEHILITMFLLFSLFFKKNGLHFIETFDRVWSLRNSLFHFAQKFHRDLSNEISWLQKCSVNRFSEKAAIQHHSIENIKWFSCEIAALRIDCIKPIGNWMKPICWYRKG